jgi:hypothetical protein
LTRDEWQKYANLRLLFGYMYGMPGNELLFMGCGLAQWPEWNHESSHYRGVKDAYDVLALVSFGGRGVPLVKSCTLQCSPLHFAYTRGPHRTSEGLH